MAVVEDDSGMNRAVLLLKADPERGIVLITAAEAVGQVPPEPR